MDSRENELMELQENELDSQENGQADKNEFEQGVEALQGIADLGDELLFKNDKEAAKVVRNHAIYAAIAAFIPLYGLETIAYVFILWRMYYKLTHGFNRTFKLSTVAIGFIVNIIIAGIVSFLFDLIPIVGWVGSCIIIFFQFYFSGKAYIETLKRTKIGC